MASIPSILPSLRRTEDFVLSWTSLISTASYLPASSTCSQWTLLSLCFRRESGSSSSTCRMHISTSLHFNGITYQFSAFLFGLSTAPRIFTKCMAPVAAFLRLHGINIYPYIDGWLIVAASFRDAIRARLHLPCPASAWAHSIDDGGRRARQTQNEILTGLVPFPVRSSNGPSILSVGGSAITGFPTSLVVLPAQPSHRQTLFPTATIHTGHNRRQPHGLRRSLPSAQGPWTMVDTGASAPHKSSGTASHHQSVPCIPSPNTGPCSAVGNGQHNCTFLCEQARHHTLPLSPLPSCRPLGVVLFQPCLSPLPSTSPWTTTP